MSWCIYQKWELVSGICTLYSRNSAAKLAMYFHRVCLHLLIKHEQCALFINVPLNHEIMQEEKVKCKTTQHLIKLLQKEKFITV